LLVRIRPTVREEKEMERDENGIGRVRVWARREEVRGLEEVGVGVGVA
jgi:hypothetical protein